MKIELEIPKVCRRCGFYNFNIQGSSYNKDFDYTVIKVTCMRCGNPENEINTNNTQKKSHPKICDKHDR